MDFEDGVGESVDVDGELDRERQWTFTRSYLSDIHPTLLSHLNSMTVATCCSNVLDNRRKQCFSRGTLASIDLSIISTATSIFSINSQQLMRGYGLAV